MTLVGVLLHVLSVLLQQDIRVLSTDKVRRGDKILLTLQPFDDLFHGLLISLSAFWAKLGRVFSSPNH